MNTQNNTQNILLIKEHLAAALSKLDGGVDVA